jgi:hypothetical protein
MTETATSQSSDTVLKTVGAGLVLAFALNLSGLPILVYKIASDDYAGNHMYVYKMDVHPHVVKTERAAWRLTLENKWLSQIEEVTIHVRIPGASIIKPVSLDPAQPIEEVPVPAVDECKFKLAYLNRWDKLSVVIQSGPYLGYTRPESIVVTPSGKGVWAMSEMRFKELDWYSSVVALFIFAVFVAMLIKRPST